MKKTLAILIVEKKEGEDIINIKNERGYPYRFDKSFKIKELCKTFYINIFDNLYEIKLPNITQKEIDNWNSPIGILKMELLVNNFLTTKLQTQSASLGNPNEYLRKK